MAESEVAAVNPLERDESGSEEARFAPEITSWFLRVLYNYLDAVEISRICRTSKVWHEASKDYHVWGHARQDLQARLAAFGTKVDMPIVTKLIAECWRAGTGTDLTHEGRDRVIKFGQKYQAAVEMEARYELDEKRRDFKQSFDRTIAFTARFFTCCFVILCPMLALMLDFHRANTFSNLLSIAIHKAIPPILLGLVVVMGYSLWAAYKCWREKWTLGTIALRSSFAPLIFCSILLIEYKHVSEWEASYVLLTIPVVWAACIPYFAVIEDMEKVNATAACCLSPMLLLPFYIYLLASKADGAPFQLGLLLWPTFFGCICAVCCGVASKRTRECIFFGLIIVTVLYLITNYLAKINLAWTAAMLPFWCIACAFTLAGPALRGAKRRRTARRRYEKKH